MRRQPKARSTKSTARIKQFYELTAKARDVPQAEVSVDFDGETKMKRQVRGSDLILSILFVTLALSAQFIVCAVAASLSVEALHVRAALSASSTLQAYCAQIVSCV